MAVVKPCAIIIFGRPK